MTSNPAMILASETHHMTSAAGREYRVSVALPLGYQSGPDEAWPFHDSPKRWPTAYVLDGNWYFGMVVDMIRPMSWCGGTTDAIVVGIGYPESADPIESFRSAFTRRNLDLTPTRDPAEENRWPSAFPALCPQAALTISSALSRPSSFLSSKKPIAQIHPGAAWQATLMAVFGLPSPCSNPRGSSRLG